jgi:hypothetical protein
MAELKLVRRPLSRRPSHQELHMITIRRIAAGLLLVGLLGVSACTENTGRGAAIGAAAGAGIGALGPGSILGNAASGAIAGAAGGFIYDQVKDND